MVYNGYYKVMSNIPKMGHLTTPELWLPRHEEKLMEIDPGKVEEKPSLIVVDW